MSRLTPLRLDDLDDRQREIHNIISRVPEEFVRGPIRAFLLSPDLAETAQRFGLHVRYENLLGMRLVELATLVAARAWNCQFVWFTHDKRAIKAGVAPDVVEAIRNNATPAFTLQDEAIVYSFAHEMVRKFRVSPSVYDPAVKAFGEAGVAELIGLLGYFALLAMTINGFELGLPPGVEPPLPELASNP